MSLKWHSGIAIRDSRDTVGQRAVTYLGVMYKRGGPGELLGSPQKGVSNSTEVKNYLERKRPWEMAAPGSLGKYKLCATVC